MLVGEHEDGNAGGGRGREDGFEHEAAFGEAAGVVLMGGRGVGRGWWIGAGSRVGVGVVILLLGSKVRQIGVANVGTVNHKDDGVAAAVVALPELPQRVLSAHVPDLEVHVRQRDGGDILADGRHGLDSGEGVVGEVEGFDGGEEGGFAGVVQAEEEDGVLCARNRWSVGGVKVSGKEGKEPSLLVA